MRKNRTGQQLGGADERLRIVREKFRKAVDEGTATNAMWEDVAQMQREVDPERHKAMLAAITAVEDFTCYTGQKLSPRKTAIITTQLFMDAMDHAGEVNRHMVKTLFELAKEEGEGL